MLMSDPIVIT